MTNKIGVFDSGLGGLIILKSIRKLLPQYDYSYYGDTKNLPYGNKTQSEIFDFTVKGIEYLIAQDCNLIIIACNTASAKALRKIQQKWLLKHAPNIKVLGVIVPTLEKLTLKDFPAAIIATSSTTKSGVYKKELNKLLPKAELINIATPKLVPLIEAGELEKAGICAYEYIKPHQNGLKSIILGCTHYPLIHDQIHKHFPKLKIIDQTVIIPKSLKNYLFRHQEIKSKLGKNGSVKVHFTKNTPFNAKLKQKWFK